jgi:hypothetical protein
LLTIRHGNGNPPWRRYGHCSVIYGGNILTFERSLWMDINQIHFGLSTITPIVNVDWFHYEDLYLTDMQDSIFASMDMNERISRLLRPCFHDSSHAHPTGNGVCATGFLIDHIPHICAIGTWKLTAQRNQTAHLLLCAPGVWIIKNA